MTGLTIVTISERSALSRSGPEKMGRIFLLSTNTMIEPYPVYPLGMAVVASALTSAGHTVRQFIF